ncbi:MAG: VIT domain-containing protein [Candidatus Hodarchaeales archaeon]
MKKIKMMSLAFSCFVAVNLLTMVVITAVAPLNYGSGFIVVINIDGNEGLPKIAVHNVSVTLFKNYAVTTVYEEFINEQDTAVNGTYFFPVPKNAIISNFSLTINGTTYYAECMPVQQAREQYEEAVAEGRDAAIMEFKEANLFAYSVSIRANSSLGVGIVYEQLLELKHGSYNYEYALDLSEYDLPANIDEVNLHLDLNGGNQKIKSLTCDFPSLAEEIHSAYSRSFSYHDEDIIPDKNFSLTYQLVINGSSGNLMTYTNGLDRFFLYSLAPDIEELTDGTYLGKNIIFTVDVSGSMGGNKISQVKDALNSIIQNLNPQDKFNILAYSGIVEKFRTDAVQADISNIQSAISYIQGLVASGGTNINDALTTSMNQFTEYQPGLNLIVFMTDGQPTAGVTSAQSIIENTISSNECGAQVFSFGFGEDLNFPLLEDVSYHTGGKAFQIDPLEEDIELELMDFYTTVENPLMTMITLEFTSLGADVQDTVPSLSAFTTSLETLFEGNEKLVTGKMNSSLEYLDINLTALVGSYEVFSVEHSFNLTETESTDFVERLWASRKISSLLEIMPYITNEELRNATIEEIVEIALDYGFATPYTALLIDPAVMGDKKDSEDENNPPGSETYTATTNPASYTSTANYYSTETETDNQVVDSYLATPAPGWVLPELFVSLSVATIIYYKKRRKDD